MAGEPESIKTKLNDVWRTCNKIRAAIHRIGINLWDHFKVLDPKQNTLISESKFINVFGQQLRGLIGLSEEEIAELTDYFRVQDGRIAYTQLCNVIHENVPDHTLNADLVTGMEWEDPLHCNRLAHSEHRRLCVLLTKIAHTVRLRELVLRPYFQDYELVAKNVGTVTLAHFSRVLHFLGLMLSAVDFALLVKRFVKDSYTVNYVAFVEEVEKVVQYLDRFRLLDYSHDVIENYPGRLLDAELPKLPRPEVGAVNIGEVYGKETSFHPVLKVQRVDMQLEKTVLRIKRHTLDNQVRVADFLQHFDPLRCGFITRSQFARGLDLMGVSGLQRLYLSDAEVTNLALMYKDEHDESRVNWKSFETDIEEVVAVRCLDKRPYEIVDVPETAVVELERVGQADWQQQTEPLRSLCEEALFKVRAKISKRRLYLEPFFKAFDSRLNIGHVSRSQMRQVLLTNGILLSDEEMYALERRFNNDMGFNYMWFLREADPADYAVPKFTEFREKQVLINGPPCERRPTLAETDIVQVVAKIKGQTVRQRMRIVDFMEGFDAHRELCICEPDFRRGMNSSGVKLSEPEVNLVCEVFKSPLRAGCIDYKRFCQIIEEAFYQPCLERAPLIVPLQHFTSECGPWNFLNFDERTSVSRALETLNKHHDDVSNLRELFQDYDRCNCGTLNRNQFLRALTVRGLHNVVSSREFELLCKCFAIERGMRDEVDYRSFLKNLEILACTRTNHPF